jgi:nitrogen fixation-related uncharacterized protein
MPLIVFVVGVVVGGGGATALWWGTLGEQREQLERAAEQVGELQAANEALRERLEERKAGIRRLYDD